MHHWCVHGNGMSRSRSSNVNQPYPFVKSSKNEYLIYIIKQLLNKIT